MTKHLPIAGIVRHRPLTFREANPAQTKSGGIAHSRQNLSRGFGKPADAADAGDVHSLICLLEKPAAQGLFNAMSDRAHVSLAKEAGAMLQDWIQSVTRFGAAAFMEEEKYFVAIPIALMKVLD